MKKSATAKKAVADFFVLFLIENYFYFPSIELSRKIFLLSKTGNFVIF